MEDVLIKDFCENNNFTSIVNRSTWNKSPSVEKPWKSRLA